MGLPLILVGIGAGKFMPKPGGWMSTVSKTFGVVMLGVAIFMIGKIVPAWFETLLMVTSIYGEQHYLWGVFGWTSFLGILGGGF